MKKTALMMAIILAATTAFTGCSSATSGSSSSTTSSTPPTSSATAPAASSSTPTPAGEKMELNLWLTPSWKGVFESTEPGADYDSFFKEAGKRYNEKVNPNVSVKVQVIAGDQRDEKINVAMQSNSLPDIIYEGAFTLANFMHKGAIEPINDIVTEADKKDIAEGLWDASTVNGQIFCYPFSHMPGTLAYNADFFKQAGLDKYIGGQYDITTWTPDELRTILTTLKEKMPNIYPMSFYAKNNQADTWNLCYIRMFGNEFFDKDNKLVTNQESGVKALQFMLDLVKDGLTVPGPESLVSNDCNAMFINQQVAISFTNSILLNNLLADMKTEKSAKFDVRLANIPGDPKPHTFTYVSGGIVMKTGDPARVAASKDFVKFFSSDKELVLASKNGMPCRTSVIEQVKKDNPYMEAQNKNAQYMINFSNNLPGYTELRNVLFPEIQAALTGEKTAQQAMDDYVAKGNVVLEEGMKNSVVFNK